MPDALSIDAVAKVLCQIEGRRTGRPFDDVVAPGIELWTRHRYEAESLLEDLQPLLAAHDAALREQIAGLVRSKAHELIDGKDPEMDPRIFDPWDVADILNDVATLVARGKG